MPTSSSSKQVNIRLAKFSEIYACAQCLAQSFHNDSLFGERMHPYRDQYPNGMPLLFYHAWLSEYFDWSMVFLVATVKDENEKDIIIGFAQWHRVGETAKKYGWGLSKWDPRNLLSPLLKLYSSLHALIYPNRAAAPSEADILIRGDPYIQHHWTTKPRSDRWYLQLLGVHPGYEKRGAGRQLVAWGLERAKKENVGASVIAAHDKDRFYNACGFTTYLGWAGDGEGNPMADVRGGNIWWVDPPGFEGGEEEGKVVMAKAKVTVVGHNGDADGDGDEDGDGVKGGESAVQVVEIDVDPDADVDRRKKVDGDGE